MNILFLSHDGSGLSIAWRMKQEGNKVRYYIKDKDCQDIGYGLVERVDNWESSVNWADFVITEDTKTGKIADDLRAKGIVVWGGSEETDKWENDKGIGQKLMQEVGMTILPSEEFNNFEKAKQFIIDNPSAYVLKPNGIIQDEKSLTYIGQDENGKDIIELLDIYNSTWGSKIKSFELQKRVIGGIEVATSGFFNGNHFIEPVEISFEHKHFMPGGNLLTGEMGTTMLWVTKSNRIFRETTLKMENKLREAGYIGVFDVNCIATKDTIYPLEFTCRFGYPICQANNETFSGNISEDFFEIANGADKNLSIKHQISSCVVIATPPFPVNSPEVFDKMSKDMPIMFKSGKLPNYTEGYYPSEVKEEEGKWSIAGICGYPLVVAASENNIDNCIQLMYSRAKKVIIPNSFYRTDIGHSWYKDINQLQIWGWL